MLFRSQTLPGRLGRSSSPHGLALLCRLRRQDVCPPYQQRQAYFSIYLLSLIHIFAITHRRAIIAITHISVSNRLLMSICRSVALVSFRRSLFASPRTGTLRTKAVSYTHLDVYKRQPHGCCPAVCGIPGIRLRAAILRSLAGNIQHAPLFS